MENESPGRGVGAFASPIGRAGALFWGVGGSAPPGLRPSPPGYFRQIERGGAAPSEAAVAQHGVGNGGEAGGPGGFASGGGDQVVPDFDQQIRAARRGAWRSIRSPSRWPAWARCRR